MKKAFFVSFLALTLLNLVRAQPDSTNAAAGSTLPSSGNVLTPQEDLEVTKAHLAALQANPSLTSEERDLWMKCKAARDAGVKPSPDVMAQLLNFNAKLRAAMIQADPKVEPILAKLEAARTNHAAQ